MHDGIKVNLLDTPGYADFVGDLRAGLRAADAALFVVSAVDGVDGATRRCGRSARPSACPARSSITQLDHPRADFEETVAACQRAFGDERRSPLYLPVHGDDGSVGGLIGLLSQSVSDYSVRRPGRARARRRAAAAHRRRRATR